MRNWICVHNRSATTSYFGLSVAVEVIIRLLLSIQIVDFFGEAILDLLFLSAFGDRKTLHIRIITESVDDSVSRAGSFGTQCLLDW
jgi:hypothetical protein